MDELSLKILDKTFYTKAVCDAGPEAILVYTAEYQEGDSIWVETSRPGMFCEIRLEDTMLPALVYIPGTSMSFMVPRGDKMVAYSPKSFFGECHVVSARVLDEEEIYTRRNLALNPYDQHENETFFPHSSANVETRGEMVFAARNTIDGMFANISHGSYPYESWGINQNPKAELKLEYGVPVELDEIRLTLRADFPHDNYWTAATIEFSDGSSETVQLEKTHLPQRFAIASRKVEWLVLKDLIKSDEASPFPALTQLETYGTIVK